MASANRFAVLVDAGFLVVGAAMLLTGDRRRERVGFDFAELASSLATIGEQHCRPASLLRTYWYDAKCPGARLSSWHEALASQANVKLRLAMLRGHPPRQKGVDSLIVRDLVVLSQERSITDALLITGDEDIREGVAYAQERGVRVHPQATDPFRA